MGCFAVTGVYPHLTAERFLYFGAFEMVFKRFFIRRVGEYRPLSVDHCDPQAELAAVLVGKCLVLLILRQQTGNEQCLFLHTLPIISMVNVLGAYNGVDPHEENHEKNEHHIARNQLVFHPAASSLSL